MFYQYISGVTSQFPSYIYVKYLVMHIQVKDPAMDKFVLFMALFLISFYFINMHILPDIINPQLKPPSLLDIIT